jgi:hypothetical protein
MPPGSQPPQHPPQPPRRALSRWLDAEPSPYDVLLVTPLVLLFLVVMFPQDWLRNVVAWSILVVASIGSDLASRWARMHLPINRQWVARMYSLQLLVAALICEITWLLWLGVARLIPALDISCGANCNTGTSLVLDISGFGSRLAILGVALLPLELLWRGARYILASRR